MGVGDWAPTTGALQRGPRIESPYRRGACDGRRLNPERIPVETGATFSCRSPGGVAIRLGKILRQLPKEHSLRVDLRV